MSLSILSISGRKQRTHPKDVNERVINILFTEMWPVVREPKHGEVLRD